MPQIESAVYQPGPKPHNANPHIFSICFGSIAKRQNTNHTCDCLVPFCCLGLVDGEQYTRIHFSTSGKGFDAHHQQLDIWQDCLLHQERHLDYLLKSFLVSLIDFNEQKKLPPSSTVIFKKTQTFYRRQRLHKRQINISNNVTRGGSSFWYVGKYLWGSRLQARSLLEMQNQEVG